MAPCEHNAERWLDHLYGLLSEEESRELVDHAAQCVVCQGSLADAQREQKRLKRASQWIRSVPAFQVPAEEPQPSIAVPSIAEVPATLPFAPQTSRRRLVRRLMPLWTAAAALLVASLIGAELYRQGGRERDQAVASHRKEQEALKERFTKINQDAAEAERLVRAEAKAGTLRMHVVGAAQTQASAPYACRIATRDLDGSPLAAQLDVKWVHAVTNEVLHRQEAASTGDIEVVLPAGLKLEKSVRLEVAAKHGTAEARVRETVELGPTNHVVHLAASKAVAQHGEVVFFRALALERFGLRPPATPLPLRFSLVDSKGKAVLAVNATTGQGGIASGEFAMVKSLPPGEYTIQVAAGEAKTPIQAQVRGLEIVDQLGNIEVNPIAPRRAYRPRDKVEWDVVTRAADGMPLKNTVVTATAGMGTNPAGVLVAPSSRSVTNDEGKAVMRFAVPDQFSGTRMRIQVEVKDPKSPSGVQRVTRTIAVVPARLEIDFYPEGGELLAGVPQRVFYRVRTPRGETASPDGSFTLLSSKGEIYTSERDQALGSFMFTPDSQETYTLRLPTGAGVQEIKNPLQNLPIKARGVAVQVRNSVAGEGEAIRVDLTSRGIERQLFAVANCRGQVVSQRYLDPGKTQAEMNLPAGVRGIVRVTIYEVRDLRLAPVAERLVYRAPAQRLDIKASAALEPGKQAQLKLQAHDEQGQPLPAWAMALVVDDQFRTERGEPSPAEQFLIGSDFGGDLADAPLVADDTPATRQALELFLGTYGWRRFLPEQEPALLAQNDATLRLFSVESMSAAEARAQYAARLQPGIQQLQHKVDQDRGQIEEERERLAEAVAAALVGKAEYERRPLEYLRLAMGILAVASLALAGLLLVLGAARMARRQPARNAFTTAFAPLGVCVALYLSASPLAPTDLLPGGVTVTQSPFPRLVIIAKVPEVSAVAPVVGTVALASPPAANAKDPGAPLPMNLAQALVFEGSVELSRTLPASNFTEHPQVRERFEATAKAQQEAEPKFGREFAYRHEARFDAQPTLLWHPGLRLEGGVATVAFDVPTAPARYRILIHGHSADGRLGFHEQRVSAPTKEK